MDRPYVIYHMLTTIDKKVTGYFLQKRESAILHDFYYQQHRMFQADAFLFDCKAAEKHFIPEQECPLSLHSDIVLPHTDFIAADHLLPCAVIADPAGTLAWDSNIIECSISCYNGAHILVLLTDAVSDAYLAYLRERNISYLFCGQAELDLELMLYKLNHFIGIRSLLVEGAIHLAGQMIQEDLVDELSLIVAPYIEGPDGLSAFSDASYSANMKAFQRTGTALLSSHGIWMRYQHKAAHQFAPAQAYS